MQTQIRGTTQIKDLSIPLAVFDAPTQALFARQQERVEVIATQGQDAIVDPLIDIEKPLYVYRNGVILKDVEYLASEGLMLFQTPVMDENEAITILVGDSPPLAPSFSPSGLPPLPSALQSTDTAIVLRDGLPYLLSVSHLGFSANSTLEPNILEPGIIE
jgi:hypothetical protein